MKATAVVAGAVLAMWCFMAVLADTLTALKGPIGGVITLSRHLDWSGHAECD